MDLRICAARDVNTAILHEEGRSLPTPQEIAINFRGRIFLQLTSDDEREVGRLELPLSRYSAQCELALKATISSPKNIEQPGSVGGSFLALSLLRFWSEQPQGTFTAIVLKSGVYMPDRAVQRVTYF